MTLITLVPKPNRRMYWIKDWAHSEPILHRRTSQANAQSARLQRMCYGCTCRDQSRITCLHSNWEARAQSRHLHTSSVETFLIPQPVLSNTTARFIFADFMLCFWFSHLFYTPSHRHKNCPGNAPVLRRDMHSAYYSGRTIVCFFGFRISTDLRV